jgi:hypothetical protein
VVLRDSRLGPRTTDAGIALTDAPRQRDAEFALAGCLTDEWQLAQLRDATLWKALQAWNSSSTPPRR